MRIDMEKKIDIDSGVSLDFDIDNEPIWFSSHKDKHIFKTSS